MTVCDLTKDFGKLKSFMKENNLSADELNKLLHALLQMEGATALSFVNIYFGYLLAKAIRDSMCKMCKTVDDSLGADQAAEAARGEAYVKRDSVTQPEKDDACFWLQFVNNMNSCPSVGGMSKPEESAHTLSRMMPPMGFPFPRGA